MAAAITIATHTINPSSPTPSSSKIHKLSLLDQIAPPVYIPLVFFYKTNQQHEEISRRLKQSLSEVLTVFYPLAGEIKRNSFVDCNDGDVEFAEARVHAPLFRFLQNPKIEEDIKQLLPDRASSYADDAVQLSVRASFFDCGGVAVGVCFSHRIGDLSSLAAFMNAWAAASRGEEVSRRFRPSFDLARHFPPRSGSGSQSPFGLCLGVTRENFMTKRLVFEREKVDKLQKKGGGAAEEKKEKNPSRVEAVSAFLWRSFVEAYKATRETSSFPASHMVGVRARAVPPLPPHTFGNCFTFATAVTTSDEDVYDPDLLVSKLRAAIRGVDGGYFDSDDKINRSVNELFKSENCIFSSWLRAPVYEVDFGWGKPARICTTGMPYMNLVVLMDTPSGDGGVEAWINVPDDSFFRLLQANYNKEFHTISN